MSSFPFFSVFSEEIKKAEEFCKKEGLKVLKVLKKGTTSISFLVKKGKKTYVLKVLRKDSPRKNLEKEFLFLEKLSKKGLTPKPVKVENDILLKEYIDGKTLKEYMEKKDIKKSVKILKELFKKAHELDKEGVYHTQLKGGKNIIIGRRGVFFIDFEKARFSKKPRNVFQLRSFLFKELHKKIKNQRKERNKKKDN